MNRPRFKRRVFRIGVIIFAGGLLVAVVWQVVADRFRLEEKALRTQVRRALTDAFPHHAREVQSQFGLFPFSGESPMTRERAPQCPAVVLIHGLDDPGSVWRNLAPALVESGYPVWYLNYPNDQPIAESARFFADCLQTLALHGFGQMVIVAHSMGGLVTREMLTNPLIDYPLRIKKGQAPAIGQLIMIGTPNHGSELARLRIFTEIRDQWVALTRGQGHWMRWIFDGAGEAKIDLLPGSEFLMGLNARPHPAHVDMLIIAGLASPWKASEIERLKRQPSESDNQPETALSNWGNIILSVTNGLGDGLVTVESTRLNGVPHVTVDGTHMTMIRNFTQNNSRVPPSVPVILNRLSPCTKGHLRR